MQADGVVDFLPERLFDAHAHLFMETENNSLPRVGVDGAVSYDVWRARVERQVGAGKLSGGLFFASPNRAMDLPAANQWVLQQLDGRSGSRALLLTAPDSRRDDPLLDHAAVAGFKVYHCFAKIESTWEAAPEQYIPEWIWQVADERGWVITLHMVRERALADKLNQRYIRDHAVRYPRATLILAHGARGFHYPNTQQGVSALRGLENIRFDASAVCEPQALAAIIEAFGPRKLMWGTDFPVSEIVGRCVTLGDDFIWLQEDTVKWEQLKTGCRPWPVGLESLRALRQAADDLGLNAGDLRDIFHDNAARLFGLHQESGDQTASLYRRARQLMPGGTQLLSKRPEMFAPDQWPAYFREARGCETWDLDGRHYYDLSSSGIGSCMLGFRDPEVTRAVRRRLMLGAMSTLNPPEEVALADKLLQLHPWAQAARFARTGGEIGAVAARIARASTRRSFLAVCGYHGWHDWYLAANLGASGALDGHLLPGLDPLGVPRELAGTTLTFRYNDLDGLRDIVKRHGDHLAAVIMEPCRHHPPQPGFLEGVRELTRACGALMVFDEITIGWRLAMGGAHLRFGVMPDMAYFAKTLGNGHPMAALIGTQTAMEGAHASFISSTYWTESIGPAAALATIERMQALNAREYTDRVGGRIAQIWRDAAAAHGLEVRMGSEFNCHPMLIFEHPEAPALKTLYTQEMLAEGFLAATGVFPTMAHDDAVLDLFAAAVDRVFDRMRQAVRNGKIRQSLKGPPAHSGFRRLL